MILRPAGAVDHPAILALWNPVIRATTITFTSEEKTAASLDSLIGARRAAGHEFWVAESGGAVLGFASYGQFRAGDGYAHALEHTILLAEAARGQGVGRALMTRLEDHARVGGGHTLFAGVSGENRAAVAFHERLGFRTLAVLPEAGRKFGRWLDLVLMMKRL
ncbi:MAG: N-acetyltransferase [Proteobacteria bacterium]|nr:N-acetyltransferase [Pseudomonadota bacterium]MBS0573200.1 N-acetyltransferase [Pseudomonadota bacterium]